jgi:hypothetical protein
VGFIAEVNETSMLLETEKGPFAVPFEAIARASLVFRGLEPQEPKKPAKPAKPAKKAGSKGSKAEKRGTV